MNTEAEPESIVTGSSPKTAPATTVLESIADLDSIVTVLFKRVGQPSVASPTIVVGFGQHRSVAVQDTHEGIQLVSQGRGFDTKHKLVALLGLKAEVVDSIRYPGGQCAELYPDKPIYDIPAVPVCTGQELTDALLKQIEPFSPGMHLGQEVQVVKRQDDDTFLVETSKGQQFNAKAVVIAAGVGSFQPRPLRVPNGEEYEGTSLRSWALPSTWLLD